jgi:hypothetical protein
VIEDTDVVEDAIAVRVTNEPSEKFADADLSAWFTVTLAGGGTEPAAQLIPQDQKRHRAVIMVNGTAGDYVILGKRGQMSNKQGGKVFVGNSPVTESAAEVWYCPTATTSGDPIYITVEDERYL